MARPKKTAAVEEAALTIEAVDSGAPATAPVEETAPAVQDNSEAIKLALAELDYEAAKLGHIGHLYYAKKVGERIQEISQTLKHLL